MLGEGECVRGVQSKHVLGEGECVRGVQSEYVCLGSEASGSVHV